MRRSSFTFYLGYFWPTYLLRDWENIIYLQCLNLEKLAGGWTFRLSEPDQNYDVNPMYIVYSWPPRS